MEREYATKRGKKSQPKRGGNAHKIKVFLLCIVVVGIAVISFIMGQYWNKTGGDITSLINTTEVKDTAVASAPNTTDNTSHSVTSSESSKLSIRGSWYSTDNGVMLSIDDNSFSIDYSNVDTKTPIKGGIKVDKDRFVFSNDNNDGIYTYRFTEDSTLILKLVDDNHLKRSSALDNQEWIKF